MKTELTNQERIIIALMRGQHVTIEELNIAKQQVHVIKLQIESLTPKK